MSDTPATLGVIIASTRPGRVGPRIAEWFVEHACVHGVFDVTLIDLHAVGLPFLDEQEHPSTRIYEHQHSRDWSAIVDGCDAFVFVMPEYNFGFTAPIKNAIDFLYHEWADKPVGFVSYGMTSAGLRAVQMLKPVVSALKMLPVTDAVAIPLRNRLDDDGVLHPDNVMSSNATAMLDELARLTPMFAALRAAS